MKILTVDDSKTSLMLLKVSLEKLGHQVVATANPKKAIELFKKEMPDLVILDVIMEGMDGYECARQIRALCDETQWIPIIFLSAQIDDASIEKGIEAGGDYYMTKPYTDTILRAKIKAMQRIAKIQRTLSETTQELKKLNDQLHAMSFTDELTGVPNRRAFNDAFLNEWNRATRLKNEDNWLSLIMVDIDHFKFYNDTYGHQAGDVCLQNIAKTLAQSLQRNTDLVARYGGEEFIILLPHTTKLLAMEQGERLRKNVEDLKIKLDDSSQESSVTISLGVSSCAANHQLNHLRLLNACDMALYEAKSQGRNRTIFKEAFTQSR